jgi:hypothetical protein
MAASLRPSGRAAPTAGAPPLERHTVISSLVRLTYVIGPLTDVRAARLACSSADDRTADATQVSLPTNLALLLVFDANLVGRRPAVATIQCLALGHSGPKYAEPRPGDRLLHLDIDRFVGCIIVFILENLLVDVL